jgi:hypothetical protein
MLELLGHLRVALFVVMKSATASRYLEAITRSFIQAALAPRGGSRRVVSRIGVTSIYKSRILQRRVLRCIPSLFIPSVADLHQSFKIAAGCWHFLPSVSLNSVVV